jgi:hypothetical protein
MPTKSERSTTKPRRPRCETFRDPAGHEWRVTGSRRGKGSIECRDLGKAAAIEKHRIQSPVALPCEVYGEAVRWWLDAFGELLLPYQPPLAEMVKLALAAAAKAYLASQEGSGVPESDRVSTATTAS